MPISDAIVYLLGKKVGSYLDNKDAQDILHKIEEIANGNVISCHMSTKQAKMALNIAKEILYTTKEETTCQKKTRKKTPCTNIE